jgi:multidrug efflux pump subunit AcrA (membrane-fusion protein)
MNMAHDPATDRVRELESALQAAEKERDQRIKLSLYADVVRERDEARFQLQAAEKERDELRAAYEAVQKDYTTTELQLRDARQAAESTLALADALLEAAEYLKNVATRIGKRSGEYDWEMLRDGAERLQAEITAYSTARRSGAVSTTSGPVDPRVPTDQVAPDAPRGEGSESSTCPSCEDEAFTPTPEQEDGDAGS